MKKFLSILLAAVMVISCVMALSSCSLLEKITDRSEPDPEPVTDFYTAEENLIRNNYYVTIEYSYDEDLGVGVEKVLKAYDLTPFFEKMIGEAEANDEEFDFDEWKSEIGMFYEEALEDELRDLGIFPHSYDLIITKYTDQKMAEINYDEQKLRYDYYQASKEAEEMDAEAYGPHYNENLVNEEYEEKYEEWNYEKCKYLLDNYADELSAVERFRYELVVKTYEKGGDEDTFGINGDTVWSGSVKAIIATQG